jgi:predicted transposase YdaD
MEDDPLHQPHDKLFKLGFSDPATAAALLREQFSARISEAVDWDKLELLPGSFIDPRFRAHESDLLFAAPLAGSVARFYLLFEDAV